MEEKEADKICDLKAVKIDKRAVELSNTDECTRRTLNMAIRDYNQALVKHKTNYQHILTYYRPKKRKFSSNRVLLKNMMIILLK